MLAIIKNIIKQKEEARKYPTHPLIGQDLISATKRPRQEVEKLLDELVQQGIIKVGNTINDRYVEIL